MSSNQPPLWPDPTIDTHYDREALLRASNESEFVRVAFELLKQAGILVALPVVIRNEGSKHGWERDDAILVGHLLRMHRLIMGSIRQIADGHPGDLQVSTDRQFIDSAATLVYLLEDDGSGERYNAYIFDSLIAERELLAEVERNVEARAGDALPIEERLRASIEETLAAAGVTIDQIPGRRGNKWPSAKDRIDNLGSGVYFGYRAGSSVIHGAFGDIEKHYLERVGDRFEVTGPLPFRPQTLTMMSQMTAYVTSRYMQSRRPDLWQHYGRGVEPFFDEVHQLDELHEDYLTLRRQREG
jgi:hypothetical protein